MKIGILSGLRAMTHATDVLCPRCGGDNLAKVKGCIVCLDCHFKQDCNGW